ncbi:biotin--[acetyl-CoA-carboxylase] ligase [Oenococcus sicerae]|uniref:Bifunctional ligase/repressor BirA n=1 Tax=Oenococcus sicerae TaxID=2203724 RepID=A0AAJ1RBF9_9LACO|nr:biotin--[acetyl-CoA-carboxylase] ligase [Oenococcus sicerae]MDN6900553.1 biotin--[acetyl-CoA-carboxylase] ligase [Oenococcus sicerae]QAS69430.1 biotin--[acetyl-CoA-carboxylase] ligase [Oenococcus sicerae]
MPTWQRLLVFLSSYPEEWFSGTKLASKLSLTRSAVWKNMKVIADKGYTVESHHGLGYRLIMDDQLNESLIQNMLTVNKNLTINVFDQVSSTNTIAKQLLTTDLKKATVVIANQQTAGYGRQNRSFYSPAKSGIYMSIALPLIDKEKIAAGLLTTGTAVAVGLAIKKVFHRQVKYKWVNDIILDNRKCGGILTEAVTDLESGRIASIIVGIGLNLTLDQSKMPSELINKAGPIAKRSKSKRNILIAEILNQFFLMYKSYRTGAFLKDYRKHSLVLDKTVTVVVNRKQLVGHAEQINSQGGLILKTTDGQLLTITSGEITKLNLLEGNYHE